MTRAPEHIGTEHFRRWRRADTLIWLGAALLVLGAQAAIGLALMRLPPMVGAVPEAAPNEAVMLELVEAPASAPVETAEAMTPETISAETAIEPLQPEAVAEALPPDSTAEIVPKPDATLAPELPEPVTPVPPETEPEPQPAPNTPEALAPEAVAAIAPEVVPAEEPEFTVAMPMALPDDLRRSRENTPATEFRPRPRQTAPAPEQPRPAQQQQTAQPRPASQSSQAASGQAPADWQRQVLQRLESRKQYPASLQRQGVQGVTAISFVIDAAGRVVSARVTRSSGSTALDEAAVATAWAASPFPAPPSALGGASQTLTASLRFNLR